MSGKSVREIPLENAMSGMTLAKPILEKSGLCLMSAGAELSEKSLHALKQRGVLQVSVVVHATEEQQQELDQRLARMEVLFRNCLDNGPNRELMACLRKYRMGAKP